MKYTSVHFGPGASKCFIYLGAVQSLIDAGLLDTLQVEVWGGVSAGSMFALAFMMGLTPKQVGVLFSNIDMHLLFSDAVGHDESSDDAANESLGLIDTKKVRRLIESLFEEFFSVPDLTFSQLRDRTSKLFKVQVTNLTKREPVVYSAGTTPDMSVVTALQMSIAFPILFPPVRHQNELFVDGGLIRDLLPIDDPLHTLNLSVFNEVGSPPGEDYDTMLDYILDVLDCFYSLHHRQEDKTNLNHLHLKFPSTISFEFIPEKGEFPEEVFQSGVVQGEKWIQERSETIQNLQKLIHNPCQISGSELHDVCKYIHLLPVSALQDLIGGIPEKNVT